MGQETKQLHYTKQQEQEFYQLLQQETNLLKQWIKAKKFKNSLRVCGYEAEGWIIKEQEGVPYACSDKFLEDVADSHITPELSKFNFEINGNPFPVNKDLPLHLKEDFQFYWKKCSHAAAQQKSRILFIGTYPDLTRIPFGMKQIFPRNRYYAINNRIHSLRKKSAHINIQGRDTLILNTSNIIHEAETTSLQIHLQTDFSEAKDFYNASLIASPIMCALCANSPFVYGKELWDESRIPLFEQVISLDIIQNGQKVSRVGLGHGFVDQCISELFEHNLLHPILLPEIRNKEKKNLQHLLFHNGTIWRWNRPLIGFDEAGNVHFRIEHRVPSSGPSLVDMQANILFFIGLVHLIKNHISRKKLYINFQTLKKFFYLASQFGLSSEMKWLDEKTYKIHHLISEKLITPVKKELNRLSVDNSRTDYLINDVIKNRAASLQNGASWQKAFIHKFGKKFDKMVESYWHNQQKDIPVYQWKV